MTKEDAALSRVLMVSREVYSALAKGEQDIDQAALLDSLSAALSHYCNEKKPLAKCMRALRSEIKRAGRQFYKRIKPQFSKLVPVTEFDKEKAAQHIPAMIFGNDRICARIVSRETDKVRSMADAMRNYPGFLFGEFEALTPEQFYDLVFGYYPKLYDEPFMEEMKDKFR